MEIQCCQENVKSIFKSGKIALDCQKARYAFPKRDPSHRPTSLLQRSPPRPRFKNQSKIKQKLYGGEGEKSSKSRMSFFSSSIHVAMTFLIEKSDSEKMTQCTASLVRAWLMRIRPAASLTFTVQDTQWLPRSDLKLHFSMKIEHTFIRQAQQRGLA